jgi:hypothetical protein
MRNLGGNTKPNDAREASAADSQPTEANTHIVGETRAARNDAETWDNENEFREQADGYFGEIHQ